MISVQKHNNDRKRLAASLLTALLLSTGCNQEEDAKDHLQKGIEYLNKGEYEKAKLELKTSNQSDKDTAETYYYLALLDEKNNQFKSMKENLIKNIELAPKHYEARIKLGKVLLLFNEFDGAMEQAETVLRNEPQNLQALTLKASVLIRQKNPQQALSLIDNILKIDPNFTDAMSLRALIYMESGDNKAALDLINKALKHDTKNVGMHLFKIQLHAKQREIDAVLGDYQELITLFPENQDYKIMLARLYTQSGKLKEAENLLETIIEKAPNNARPKLLMLDFYEVSAKEKVIDKVHQYTEQHKDDPKILLELANWLIARANYNEANIILDQVIEQEDDSDIGILAKFLLAKNTFYTKDLVSADKQIDEILKINSNYDNAKILRARILLANKKTEEAIELLKKTSWSTPNSDEVMVLLGQAYQLKGDKKEADKSYSKALELNPGNTDALIQVYEKALATKNLKYAQEILEKSLRVQPENIVLLEKLAKIKISEHDWNSADDTVKRISVLSNPLAADLANLLEGKIFEEKGDCKKAVQIYQESIRKFPQNAESLTSMARCYETLQKREEMISFINNLLQENPKNLTAGLVLGDLLLLDKKYDQGIKLINNLLESFPKNAQLYLLLANYKLANNDQKTALEILQQGLKKDPENINLSLTLASLYEKQGVYEPAIAIYENLLAKNPQLDIAINNLTSILTEHSSDKNKLDNAVQLAERFKDSDQPYFKDTYGWALIKQGNIIEGLNILNQVIIAAPDVPVFRYHLGVALYKNGDSGSAISELKQALEFQKKSGSFSEKKEAETLLEDLLTKTKTH